MGREFIGISEKDTLSPLEFIENFKIDFACTVRTDIENNCVAVKNRSTYAFFINPTCYTGQTVEVITSESGCPNPAWLDFIVIHK